MNQTTFHALGSTVLIVCDAMNSTDFALIQQTFAAWEQALSRFLPTSELQSLNNQGAARVSPLVWDAIQHALDVAASTVGLVTPTVLPALLAAGYTRSFDEGFEPSPSDPPAHLASWRSIHCDPITRTITLPTDCQLDLGGTAKGWLVDQALAQLSEFGAVLVDAGGDIGVNGPQSDGQGWPIEVTHPWPDRQPIGLVILPSGGIATSGRDYRRWRSDTGWSHHLIDPRTGSSSNTDVLSATVIAPYAAYADWAAKVVLLLGSKAGLEWLEHRPELAGVVVLNDGTWVCSHRFNEFCWFNSEETPL